jgi:putative transposase
MEEQTVRKTEQYTLEPTPEQERALGRALGWCRALYNTALEQRLTAWRRARVSVSRYEQEAELKDIRANFPDYAAIHSHVLHDVLARLDKAYQAFFRRVRAGEKAGEKAGFPRDQGRDRSHSFTHTEVGNGATVENGFLVLSKIGRIAVRWSRPLVGAPETVTLSREADGWYVCLSCADVPVQPLPATGLETGMDLGIEAFATLSDAPRIFSSGWYRKAARALNTARRRVSRRKKGSHRRRTAVTLLAKAHQTVRRQRQDFPHKTALALVRANDTVSHEDVQTATMVRNHQLAKSISDAGWSAFLSILAAKAADAGRRVVAVSPASTSQSSSGCGVVVHKGLSVRWHRRPACGTSPHRDHNAARNRERFGQNLRGGVVVAASENRASVRLEPGRSVNSSALEVCTLLDGMPTRSVRSHAQRRSHAGVEPRITPVAACDWLFANAGRTGAT